MQNVTVTLLKHVTTKLLLAFYQVTTNATTIPIKDAIWVEKLFAIWDARQLDTLEVCALMVTSVNAAKR